MANHNPTEPPIEPLERIQILVAMGVTALLLLLVARIWLIFDSTTLLSVAPDVGLIVLGMGIGMGITGASAILYHLWPAYRKSADAYLKMILQPLTWADLMWMGLLPGLSEEFLFRGVMLPAIGLNLNGIVFSSLCFGVLHLSSLQQWPYVLWATLIGGVLGASALFSGNLLVPIVAHITTNLVSSLVWKARLSAE